MFTEESGCHIKDSVLKAGRELGNAEDCLAIAVYSLGEHSDQTARADDNPIVKGDAQMSEGSS